MTVVVTGAAGHLGANLVRGLIAQGQRVRVLVHQDRRAIEGLDVEVVEGDVCDVSSLRSAFAGAEIVYHAAAHISLLRGEWSRCQAVNATGTGNVVEACLHGGVRRLVHFSSIHALERQPLDLPVDETRALVDSRDRSPYSCSKAEAERAVQRGVARGLDAVILNPTAIIGPHDYKPSHFGQVLLALARGRLPALVDGGFNWVDARDVVWGALRAAERAPSGARYLLSGHWVALRDVAAIVEAIVDVPAPRLICPLRLAVLGAPLATAGARLVGKRPLFTSFSLEVLRGHRFVSHARAAQELGYHPRAFTETIADTLRFFAERGRLPNLRHPSQESLQDQS